jgi:ribose/xylose/arabinose/galactoside ABC-type transport system permease subunit
VVGNGLNMMTISTYWQMVIIGMILIAAVASQKVSFNRK